MIVSERSSKKELIFTSGNELPFRDIEQSS
jgi:hypothetical protein